MPADFPPPLTQRIPPQVWIAREGWPFVGGALALALLAMWLGIPLLFWGSLLLAGLCAAFFRNPHRIVPQDAAAVISPADGRVLCVEPHDDPFFGRGAMQRITIFLSVADVHINRMPIAGQVTETRYQPGQFLMAYDPAASTRNECLAVHVQGDRPGRQAIVVQIAGKIARRIVCYLRAGDPVAMGMRYGLIRFGSRMDLYLPLSVQVAVQAGMRVRGGETILARFGAEGAV